MKVYVLIKNNDKLELYKAKEYEEFLVIKQKKKEIAIPKPKTFYRFNKSIIYVTDDSILDTKYDPEILNRLIRKKFIMSIFEALRPKINIRELIGYIAAAGIFGFYLRDTIEHLSVFAQRIIERTPPETLKNLSMIFIIGIIGIIIVFMIKSFRR